MKNIALCFSGGIRYFDSCFPSIYKYFINPLKQENNVDIFLHLTYINKLDDNIKVKFKMIKSTYHLETLLEKIKPKKYKIYEFTNEIQKNDMLLDKNYYDHNWGSEKNQNYAFSAFGMYSKIHKCNELRKQYEKENNISYDFVWRGRLDYIFYDYINFDMIDNANENNIYLIKDRYAHNTKKELNDKFFGAKPDIMDNLCQIYYELPLFMKDFKEKKIFFDGQFVIFHKITKILNSGIANNVKMIGHRNTYCKCQCRHSIQDNNKKIYISLENDFFHNLCYKFLYDGYDVYSNKKDNFLSLFSNFKYSENYDNIVFNYCIIKENDTNIISDTYIIISN